MTDEQGVIRVNGEGLDIVSLEDDFKSLLIGKRRSLNNIISFTAIIIITSNAIRYCTVPVPLNSEHSNVKVQSDEVEIHSDVEVSSFADQGWCNITRNSDLSSATSENKRYLITKFGCLHKTFTIKQVSCSEFDPFSYRWVG
ncbi:hypothetical protein Hanom_Chr01g00062991 [Helianthus anomalus]